MVGEADTDGRQSGSFGRLLITVGVALAGSGAVYLVTQFITLDINTSLFGQSAAQTLSLSRSRRPSSPSKGGGDDQVDQLRPDAAQRRDHERSGEVQLAGVQQGGQLQGHLCQAGGLSLPLHLPPRDDDRHDHGQTLNMDEVTAQAAGAFTDATYPRTSAAGSEYAAPSASSTAFMYSAAHSGRS
jgi:hypothetical protein